MPHDAAKEKNQEMGGVEEEGDAVEEQGGDSEGPDAGSEGGNENDKENRGDGGRRGKDKCPPLRFQKYKEAAKKYYLHHTDGNMVGRETRSQSDSHKQTNENVIIQDIIGLMVAKWGKKHCESKVFVIDTKTWVSSALLLKYFKHYLALCLGKCSISICFIDHYYYF